MSSSAGPSKRRMVALPHSSGSMIEKLMEMGQFPTIQSAICNSLAIAHVFLSHWANGDSVIVRFVEDGKKKEREYMPPPALLGGLPSASQGSGNQPPRGPRRKSSSHA